MDPIFVLALVAGCAGVLWGLVVAGSILKLDAGTKRMQEISAAVQEGAEAFLKREYSTVFVVAIALVVVIALVPQLGLDDGHRLPHRRRRFRAWPATSA